MKIIKYLLIIFIITASTTAVYLYNALVIKEPVISGPNILKEEIKEYPGGISFLGNSWFKKNTDGLSEMYIEGEPYQRGLVYGMLASEPARLQEKYFIDQINVMIPSASYLNFLKIFVGWFNRNLNDYVDEEFRQEIYGMSRSASDEYDFIGPKYQRILYYHAAHDIGHALLNLHLVGCTSFSVKNSRTADRKLLTARNFDFYMGDEFSRNKIVAFYNPAKGFKFMFITWGGMTGVVSGMNEHGLAVTINAAEGEIPLSAAVPISLIVREILQYSKNIDDAVTIAKKRKSFVSESIMISSASDNKTVIIEKTPETTEIFNPDGDVIISTNHFQKNNSKSPEESSLYRFKRVSELVNKSGKLGIHDAVSILRDHKGLNGKNIGLSNEKTVNQFLAHHSVIFKPDERIVWVSSAPWQSGKFYAYNLKKIFAPGFKPVAGRDIYENSLTISGDPFLKTDEYNRLKDFLKNKQIIRNAIIKKIQLPDSNIQNFISSNPELYLVYQIAADYYSANCNYQMAGNCYKAALTKEIARSSEKEKIIKSLSDAIKKINNE